MVTIPTISKTMISTNFQIAAEKKYNGSESYLSLGATRPPERRQPCRTVRLVCGEQEEEEEEEEEEKDGGKAIFEAF
jgi:hypothetical protein